VNKDWDKAALITIGILACILFAIIGSYVSWFYFMNDASLSLNSGDWGAFGDLIGGILNPIVAFSALCWLIISVKTQKEELKAVKDELITAHEIQIDLAKTQKIQRFENTLFSLLEHYRNIDEKLSTVEYDGGVAKKTQLSILVENLLEIKISSKVISPEEEVSYKLQYGYYFMISYQLLKLVDEYEYEDKHRYFGIVGSFISGQSLLLLALACSHEESDDYKKCHLLLEKYGLLKGINGTEKVIIKYLKTSYKDEAFI